MPKTDLLTAAEVAERFGISARTVGRWVKAGRLVPELQLPGQTGAFLFDRDAIEALASDTAAAS